MKRTISLAALVPFLVVAGIAQDLKEFEKRVTEFTLPNGLHFIVLERREAPVVSFHTYVNAGAVDDPEGATGLAHMFEHMAFKGTETIGTRNYPAEEKTLKAIEDIYDKIEAEQRKRKQADPAKIKALEADLKGALEKAQTYVEPNAYPRIVEENGGEGMNANTGMDSTNYYYSLPSNRAELWFLLESSRFYHPVFREFYKERDVVREERRMRTESSVQGKLIEMLQTTAFAAHPYRNPGVGWASDIESLRASEAREFYKTYYTPWNITIGIAGDVSGVEMKRLAEKYFSRLPAGPPPPLLHTVEPPQGGERRASVISPSQPFVVIGYRRPNQTAKDDATFDVISQIVASGRTGLLYKELVRDKKIALAAGSISTFPGGKYDTLYLFYLVPSVGHTMEENEKACYDIIERLKTEKVDAATLERVKTKVRASLIRQLDDNSGLAEQLAWYHVNYGDWRKLFTGLEDINKVTADDVQRVVKQYLVPESRTVAYTVALKGQDAEESK